MPVRAIIDKIMSDARTEAEKVAKEVETEMAGIKKDTEKEIGLIHDQATKQAGFQAREERERLISAAGMELKQAFLQEKQMSLEKTFNKAKDKITNARPEEYKEFMAGLLASASEDGDEEVIVAESDKDKITSELLRKVNQRLQSEGKNGQLKLSPQNRNMPGGFVLRKGRKEINCSLETIFSTARMELESEVAAILFGEDKKKSGS